MAGLCRRYSMRRIRLEVRTYLRLHLWSPHNRHGGFLIRGEAILLFRALDRTDTKAGVLIFPQVCISGAVTCRNRVGRLGTLDPTLYGRRFRIPDRSHINPFLCRQPLAPWAVTSSHLHLAQPVAQHMPLSRAHLCFHRRGRRLGVLLLVTYL